MKYAIHREVIYTNAIGATVKQREYLKLDNITKKFTFNRKYKLFQFKTYQQAQLALDMLEKIKGYNYDIYISPLDANYSVF